MWTSEQSRAAYNDLIAAGKFPETVNTSPHRERKEWRVPEAAVENFRKENSAREMLKRAPMDREKAAGED